MGGSMGFGKLPKLVKQLQSSVSSNDRIICICGKNEKLKQQLTKLFHESSTVKVLGYTREIPLLMDASDVLLTKPGGITSTEAIIKNIPIVHINPIKGLEEDNAAFFRKMRISLGGDTIKSQVEMATRLSHNADAQREMIEAQRQNSNQNCSNDIADLIINIAQQQHS
jgi:processive 1,2-diacylglycerol beta-glucosyltransferase